MFTEIYGKKLDLYSCSAKEFSQKPGVYACLGVKPTESRISYYYIGRAENVLRRLVFDKHEKLKNFRKEKWRKKIIAVHYLNLPLIYKIIENENLIAEETIEEIVGHILSAIEKKIYILL